MQQPNYPPRGYGGQAPPQQQQQAPRSGGGYAPPNPGPPSNGANSGVPQVNRGPPGAATPGRSAYPGQGSPAPGSFQNATPAPGPGSFQSGPPGPQGPPRQQFQQGPPGPGQQFNNAPPPQGGRPGPPPPQFGGQMQGPPPPQFNGQQGPPQGGAAPYLQPNRNAGPYPGPPGPGGATPPYGAPGAPGAYGQPQQGGYPQQQQPQASQAPKQRIDPTQIPRPVVSAERVQYVARGHTVTMPPPASSDYVCVDEGCCNPRFIRPTLNHVPANKELLKQCGLPLAAVICPLADLQEDELPIPLVDFGPNGPLRCTRCAAYVNSFTKFIQGGRKFVCNICQLNNETPRDYYCSVDQYGKRRDIQERAELSRGSVEYVVPAAYTIRPPQEPILVFVLDVSLFSFQTGLATNALQSIQYLLPSMAQNKRKKIGIVTFDTAVHYYRMDNGSSSISMSICPDIDDPVAPLPPSSWLVSMDDPAASDKITELSEVITRSFETTTKNQAVSGAALWSVADALSVSGGRVVLLHAGAPRMGIGRVKREEVSGAYGTTKEVDLYTPEDNNAYETLARQCAEHHISLDVFSVANTFASLADVGRVCELTGGRVQYMPQFEKEQSSNRHHLTSMLQRLVDRDCGYEAVLKVRCSAGLRVEHSYGNFFNARGNAFTTDEMEFAVIDQDRSMCVTFAYDEPLAEGTDAYIQAALLYTRSDGLRCVRVHNLALQVEPLLSNVFRFADLDATCSVWQRSAARQFVDKQLMRATPMAVKESLVDQCVTVLFNYRKFCASSSSSGQLILPESLKLLPLYTLATLKSRALRGNLVGNPPRGFIDVRADERVMMMGLLNSLPVEFCVSAVYPKLYSVHDLADDCCTLDEDGKFILPPQLPPTAEKLDEEGIFLLHSAMCCYIYIGPKASPELLLDLFGVDHADTAEQTLTLFETLDSEPPEGDGMSARERLRSLVEYLNSTIPISQPLEILTKNDWRANRFMSALVEDRTRNDVSYVEFLVQVHKKIQYKFH
ncbi:transport protein Sec24 CEF protein [Phytophthora nicotianae]|uniref:Transport protein Sec24 CEF protein n=1 Tax=Phytophthora nicotianae TaxID=4792 RepID=A0A0W8C3S7_PHYNI|nr:transport protein Sec24 CEF protein [Phytophthora nicotianae]KUF81839.1 transport protein Sec24 CEF protein [Phytophthora nicotianae]